MSKTIGILGGMGSYATVDFFKRILDQFEVKKEWDYPEIIISNNPKIPSRTRAILFNEESPAKGMIKGCQRLEDSGADFIVIPCNSAHAWFEEISQSVNIPILSIIEAVKEDILKTNPNIKRIGLLAGEVFQRKPIYHKAFSEHGIEIISANNECQQLVRQIIDDVKHNQINDNTRSCVESVVKYFKNEGAEGIILGCTELPLVMNRNEISIPAFDSSSILARKAAEMSK